MEYVCFKKIYHWNIQCALSCVFSDIRIWMFCILRSHSQMFWKKATVSSLSWCRHCIAWLILTSCHPRNKVNSVCKCSTGVEEADNDLSSQLCGRFFVLRVTLRGSHWALLFFVLCLLIALLSLMWLNGNSVDGTETCLQPTEARNILGDQTVQLIKP